MDESEACVSSFLSSLSTCIINLTGREFLNASQLEFLSCRSFVFFPVSSEDQTMAQSQSVCTQIQRTFAKLFNPAFEKTFSREVFRNHDELWVLEDWALSDDGYELRWINNCPSDSWKDGQTWTKKQGRHRAHGDAIYFLQSVRGDGPFLTGRWVCSGWSCMPRRFVVLIAALTSFFAFYRRPEVHRVDCGIDVSLCVASSSDTKVFMSCHIMWNGSGACAWGGTQAFAKLYICIYYIGPHF